MRILLIIVSFLLVLLSCNNPVDDGPETGTMTDIDGNVYKTVKIGEQWWMAENLRVTRYNDDTPIPQLTDSAEWAACTTGIEAFCYYNNTSNIDSIRKFGALYNWYTVHTKKLAPEGWHVPDTTDWNILESYLIANGYNWDGTTTGNKIGKAMASETDWDTSTTQGHVGNAPLTNNKSGFSGLPGGCRHNSGTFNNLGGYGYWWSAAENLRRRYLSYDYGHLFRFYYNKKYGFSVRLVKD